MHHKINHIDTTGLFEQGIQRGALLGFNCMRDNLSIKDSSTVYMYGAPFSGKTLLKYEMLMQLSEFHGWKHCIYDPETGSPESIKALLSEMYIQKDYFDTYNNKMSAVEMEKASNWLDDHFVIVDGEHTYDSFYKEVDYIEQETGMIFNTTSIDPWDDLDHDRAHERDLYLIDALKDVRRNAEITGRTNFIITHVRDQQLIREGGVSYYPAATPREIAGGQVWYRKGMTMISVWRPPKHIRNDVTGDNFEWNETHVIMQKQKPEGVALRGERNNTSILYLDPARHRFYEKDRTGMIRFAKFPEPLQIEQKHESDVPF